MNNIDIQINKYDLDNHFIMNNINCYELLRANSL